MRYEPTEAEQKSLMFRKLIYVEEDIEEGELLITINIRIDKTGNRVSPHLFDKLLARVAT